MTGPNSESENAANALLSADFVSDFSPDEALTGNTLPIVLNVAFAPGCFGSALAFDLDDPTCQTCVFASQCQPVHVQSVATLEATFAQHGDPAVEAKEKRNQKERSSYAADVLEETGRIVTPHAKDDEESAQRKREKGRARAVKFRANKAAKTASK
jgi:hypothetical protein